MGTLKCVVFTVLLYITNVKAIDDAHKAAAGEFRYHVAITVWRNITAVNLNTYETWHCSGAIISSKSVITSYECVAGSSFNGLWLGTEFRIKADCINYMNETCREYTTRLPPETTPEQAIAIIKMPFDQEISFNDRVQPVALPTHNNRSSLYFDFPNGTYFYATGYKTYDETADDLRFLIMKVVDMQDCALHLAVTIHSSRICVQGIDIDEDHANENLCTEFGVPLVFNATLVGISDYTDYSCTVGRPNLFTKIESFVDWINEHKS